MLLLRSSPRNLVFFLFLITFFSCREKNEKKDRASVPADTSLSGRQLSALNLRIEEDPHNPSLYHDRARLYMQQGNYALALPDMKSALAMDSSRADFFITLADLYFALGKSGNAKAALEKCISIDSVSKEAYLKLAELYLYVSDYRRSLEYLSHASGADVHEPKIYFMRGINYKLMGDTAAAVKNFRKAIEENPEYYEAFMQLGILYSARSDKLAVQYFNTAVRLKRASVEALYGRAMFFQENNELNKAIEDYTAILKIEPANRYAHFNLGYIHYVYLKAYEQAVKHFTDAIQADNSYAESYFNRGLCFEALGNVAGARADYEKALRMKPGYKAAEDGFKRVGGNGN